MKNSLIPYQFEDRSIRVIIIENRPWFLAADICAALDLANVTKALIALDDDEQALTTIQGLSRGNDQANIINESGLYSLIMRSRKPEARRFRKWVTSEVLPAIAHTGRYGKIELHHRLALSRQIASLTRCLSRTKSKLEHQVLGNELKELVALAGQPDVDLTLLAEEV